MLYWICPECGGECSPAVRECPACAGPPVISLASVDPVHRKPAVTEEVLALVQSVQPTSPAPFQVAPSNGHSTPLTTLALAEVATEELPPPEAIESLVRPLIESTTFATPVQLETQPSSPEGLSEAMELQAELVLDAMAQSHAEIRPAIQSIVASFQEQTKTLLLPPAPEVVTAPAPPCRQWMRIPRPHISPLRPQDVTPSDLMSGLQTPPLAGPSVPYQLRNLTEQHGGARGKSRKRAGLPAWTVSFLIALTLFLGVGTLLQYLASSRDAKAAVPTAQQASDQAVLAAPSAPQPASKLVEVTGLRVATAPNHKPQLAFIVVNHSANQLSGIGLQIAVRSASSSAGVAPLFRVSTTISSLGPYQSREFRAELDPQFHASEIPDWQSLRADVRVGAQ